MRVAVIQHRMRGSADADALALTGAIERALGAGASLLVLPAIASLLPAQTVAALPAACVLPEAGGAAVLELADSLGEAVVLAGDAAIDPSALEAAAGAAPDAVVLAPRSESDLQAEAVLELAIGLSYSLAGLVIVAETSGAEPGAPGHGGSAIVLLGEVLSEAVLDDEVLVADVATPVPRPEPREPLPEVPPILAQRVATHRGVKLEQPYPADLA